jgi:PBSX family phage terminase large subunit
VTKIKLTDCIAPSFYKLHDDLKRGKHTHYWLSGGRGSTKSSWAALEIVLGLMREPQANGVVLRKVGDTLRDSVFEQYIWAAEKLGTAHLWHAGTAPMRLIFKPTGQKIIFRGADRPEKLKSIKFSRGFVRYIHYEEVAEFGNMEDIRNINQSLIRGGDTKVIYSYNPPPSQNNWVNAEVEHQSLRPDTVLHHSTYLDVPHEWLGESFMRDAEHLKKMKPVKYTHEYLGEQIGTGAEVFTNVTQRVISDEEVARFDKIYRGIDFGFAADPLHYTALYHDAARGRIYIFDEIHQVKMSNALAVQTIKRKNLSNELITGDSADARSISEFNSLGLRIIGARKGAGSVEAGIKWLEDLNEIIIDPVRCPNTAREFITYELERDTHGNLKGNYPDKNNHSIDAVRYALESARYTWKL